MTVAMEDTKKLGFGLMRLPRRGVGINIKETSAMVDAFLEAGCTYFDTAHVYPGSEDAVKKALTTRHPRETYTIATKLYGPMALTPDAARKQFDTSLKRMGTDYIDYYLLHTLMDSNVDKYERFGLWEYVQELKRAGKVLHAGFSFHDGPELLDKLLTEHPEVEFVQLQINYADWENPKVASRANYEVARRHGVPIVVMEPVKGGNLAKPPADVARLFEKAAPGASPASWAIRFVASLDGILAVLSGMSNMAQMTDNLSYMRDFKPLTEEERAIIRRARELLGASKTIPCTACRYCTKGCPQEIPIPDIFAAMNLQLGDGQLARAKAAYGELAARGNVADACIGCGQCEEVCPQHIPVISRLEECAAALG